MKDKKKNYIIFWVIIVIIAIVFLSQFVFKSSPDQASDTKYDNSVTLEGMDNFSQCLTEKGAVFYGTSWCSHCNAQKEMFGSSLKYVNFVDCDEEREACMAAGIQGYPTWQINGGNDMMGTQQLSSLAKATGCELI